MLLLSAPTQQLKRGLVAVNSRFRATCATAIAAKSGAMHFAIFLFWGLVLFDYLVAAQNLPEGKVITEADVKVVKMPGLRGYELAFFKPYPVVRMKLSHALPYGQPVLPYHVEESMAARKYSNLSPEERAQ